jgi:hypothetical protein
MLSFSSSEPQAKRFRPIANQVPDHERNRLANEWTWNNLRNGTAHLNINNPYKPPGGGTATMTIYH